MKLRNKKTGEICELGHIRQAWREGKDGGMGYMFLKADDNNGIIYNSLAEMMDEWEDYKPTEPLIKDEKIRKAVRAWAEACGAKQIKYSIAPNQYYDAVMGTGFSIKFLTKPVEVYLEEGKTYTIAELCGEEE